MKTGREQEAERQKEKKKKMKERKRQPRVCLRSRAEFQAGSWKERDPTWEVAPEEKKRKKIKLNKPKAFSL